MSLNTVNVNNEVLIEARAVRNHHRMAYRNAKEPRSLLTSSSALSLVVDAGMLLLHSSTRLTSIISFLLIAVLDL